MCIRDRLMSYDVAGADASVFGASVLEASVFEVDSPHPAKSAAVAIVDKRTLILCLQFISNFQREAL